MQLKDLLVQFMLIFVLSKGNIQSMTHWKLHTNMCTDSPFVCFRVQLASQGIDASVFVLGQAADADRMAYQLVWPFWGSLPLGCCSPSLMQHLQN